MSRHDTSPPHQFMPMPGHQFMPTLARPYNHQVAHIPQQPLNGYHSHSIPHHLTQYRTSQPAQSRPNGIPAPSQAAPGPPSIPDLPSAPVIPARPDAPISQSQPLAKASTSTVTQCQPCNIPTNPHPVSHLPVMDPQPLNISSTQSMYSQVGETGEDQLRSALEELRMEAESPKLKANDFKAQTKEIDIPTAKMSKNEEMYLNTGSR